MTTGEIKAEWDLISVKRKRKQDRRFFETVDLNTIMCNFKTDVHVFIKLWLLRALELLQELPQCDPGGRKVEGEPPGGECGETAGSRAGVGLTLTCFLLSNNLVIKAYEC